MRIRATVATVTGALAVSTLAVPAVHAAGDDGFDHREAFAEISRAAHKDGGRAPAAPGKPYDMEVSFSNFKVAKAIKVGTAAHYSTTVTYKLTHASDIDIKAKDFVTAPVLYRGSLAAPSSVVLTGVKPATCTVNSATTATCTGRIDLYPREDLRNSDAGTWKGTAYAIAYNGQEPDGENFDITKVGHADQEGLGTTRVQRASILTVNASPEPVKKGKTLTITGRLTIANWETGKYVGYVNQSVALQFRKKNVTTYTNVKGVKTNTKGDLKTTVKASVDGYHRFTFKGKVTVPAVNATGDFVDVR
ncbi:hypothetical protein [Streptomyces sp. TRM70350]|uniref:hypothetical protein n=1 Tax=Streptomyces sp. TRM70350 TaxID=2856165 RepID=UPI001C44926C|nr:hypothetical protein [Streptomyces sp. TRM70350]MBV7696722.1 hypothetical protein [Streptomyces sp. TRM70350]